MSDQKEQPLSEHLKALRRVFLVSIIAVLAASGALLRFSA